METIEKIDEQKTSKEWKGDDITIETITGFIDAFIQINKFISIIKEKTQHKNIRHVNFHEAISENLVKFYLHLQGREPNWDNKKGGDIYAGDIKIEVKAFSSKGPTSFGPKENWDELYFVDCMDYKNKKFKIYKIDLKNTDEIFRKIKLTKEETFGEIADSNKRGKLRGKFTKFQNALGKHCVKVFDGHLDDLKC